MAAIQRAQSLCFERNTPMTNFTALPLAEPILKALEAQGYASPTPIQAQAIPPALEGRDILGIAQTGTGKTAAFVLPILDKLVREPKARPVRGTRVLILAPTRELASQIATSCQNYGRFLRLAITTVFGGVPINRQGRMLERGVDILVATPGRLLDLVDQRMLTLKDVDVLVLDEADQMMDLGFIHALKQIVTLLPKQRQTLFFSATMPEAIAQLAGKYINNPVEVAVTPAATTAERVEQFAYFLDQRDKSALLAHLLADKAVTSTLVFTRTKHGADRLVKQLGGARINAVAIHGNKSQPQREKALGLFRAGQVRVLVATDIAARGIDISGVSHVFNYELPNVPDQYVHRIGRTARAGAAGVAVALVAPDERSYLKQIEKLTRQEVLRLPVPEGLVALPKPMMERDERSDRRARPERGERRERPERAPRLREERRPEGRFEERAEGPTEGRFEGRPEGRFEPRGERRPARASEGRFAPRGERRPEGRFEGRPEGRFEPRGERRPEGRFEGRPEGRFEPRGERRPEGRFEGRPEGRFEPRGERRPEGRFEGRPEGRFEPRGERRPEGRFEGRPEGRFEGRGEGPARGGFKPARPAGGKGPGGKSFGGKRFGGPRPNGGTGGERAPQGGKRFGGGRGRG
jgi:ATP-dependent RNA helicase RhlE